MLCVAIVVDVCDNSPQPSTAQYFWHLSFGAHHGLTPVSPVWCLINLTHARHTKASNGIEALHKLLAHVRFSSVQVDSLLYMSWRAIQMSTNDTWPDSSFVCGHLLYHQLVFCSFCMKDINMIILHLFKSLELLKFIVCTFQWNSVALNGLTQNFTYRLQSTCVMKSISLLHLVCKNRMPRRLL